MPEERNISSSSPAALGFRKVAAFVCLCLLSGAGVVGYALHSRENFVVADAVKAQPSSINAGELSLTRLGPHVLFRSTAPGPSHGKLSIVRLAALDGMRHVTDLQCERVYGSATSGLCLQASRGVFTTYQAVVFDQHFKVKHTFNLAGVPSRTRVSRDGRMAATTVFVKGDSYNSGGFSTRTSLIDMPKREVIGDLETFTVTKDGKSFRRIDFNFWGISFAPDGERFFATLGTGGVLHLVEGWVSQRKLRVVGDGIECPSLSPDGTRLVFKARTSEKGRLVWRLRVLDLETGAETAVNETRSVDDQAEWLDPDHVLYGLPRDVAGSATSDIWIARADGEGTPMVFLTEAFSPCVIRP